MAPEWPGQWRRLQSSEVGKKTSPCRLAATEELGEHAEAASQTEHARGPLFIARPSRFVAAVDKFAGEPPYCAAGRRGGGWLAPGANDDHSTVEGGELARCGGLGGAAHGGGRCGRGRAAKRLAGSAAGGEEAVGASSVTWREGEDLDELGETYPGGCVGSGASTCKTRALLALWACMAFLR